MVGRPRARQIPGADGAEFARLLRAVLPVCVHAGGDPAGNPVVGLAGVHVRVHDGPGLRGSPGHVPDRSARHWLRGIVVDWQLILTVAVIAVAAAYVLRVVLRPLFGRGGA